MRFLQSKLSASYSRVMMMIISMRVVDQRMMMRCFRTRSSSSRRRWSYLLISNKRLTSAGDRFLYFVVVEMKALFGDNELIIDPGCLKTNWKTWAARWIASPRQVDSEHVLMRKKSMMKIKCTQRTTDNIVCLAVKSWAGPDQAGGGGRHWEGGQYWWGRPMLTMFTKHDGKDWSTSWPNWYLIHHTQNIACRLMKICL